MRRVKLTGILPQAAQTLIANMMKAKLTTEPNKHKREKINCCVKMFALNEMKLKRPSKAF